METKHVLLRRRFLRACLTALLLLFAAQGAWAKGNPYGPSFKNYSKKVAIDGTLYYSFDVMFFDYGGDNYFWRGTNTKIKIDGTTLCYLKDLLKDYYDVGSNSESAADNFLGYDDLVVTKQYSISGTTNVYVSVINPYRDGKSKSYYLTIEIAFERNFVDKQWEIQWSGYWNYNNGSGIQVDETLFKTDKPTVTMPSISSSSFTRSSNKKIKYTYPSYTNYSGWATQTIMYKEDCTNKWLNPNTYSYTTMTGTGEFNVSDNYTPVTIYPRFEYYKNAVPASKGSDTYVFRFDKDYSSITIPGQPRPANVNVSAYNTYNKQVTISWERDAYDKNTATDGKWIIFRKLTGQADTQIKLGEVPNGTYTYTDKKADLVYGNTYTYTVCYQPKGWTIENESEAEGLNGYVRYTLNRDFSFSNLSTEVNDGKIIFNWSHNEIKDASNSKAYTLYVQRSDDNGQTWKDLRTDKITSSSTTSGSYTDADVQTHKPYQYRVKINVQDADVYSSPETATVTTGSTLTGFTASRGNYSTSVKLNWTVNQVGTEPTYFTLQRRPLGSDNENLWADIYTTSGTASTYSYDDNTAQPGSFNEYRLKIFDIYNGTRYEGTAKKTDGFCLATGVVSGRITYGSGTAVEGVKISMGANNADGESIKSNRSLRFDGSANTTTGGSGLTCTTTSDDLVNIFGNDFTVQMWINPSSEMETITDAVVFFDVPKAIFIDLQKVDDTRLMMLVGLNNKGITLSDTVFVPYDKWTNVALTYQKNTHKVSVYSQNGKDSITVSTATYSINDGQVAAAGGVFGIGNWAARKAPICYNGYIDDFRVFNRALSKDELEKNYNHTLNGSEEGLQVYWPLDEGLANQTIAYDFSKQNGVSNGHHATTNVAAKSEANVVPSDEQLSLMTYTDKDGNYMLRGIPFQGEGTSYTVTPTLGVHRFDPANEKRFFNLNSLSYSGVNFEDVSSFPVSGTVYFDGTTIPVEEALIYVDGNLAAKDGEAIKTNSLGEFKVDVPIGDHFIQVKKSGHTFVNNGRWPEDPDSVGNRYTFEKEEKGVTFYDNTRVTVAGRVTGGDIEYEKPLGLRASVANIGKARITLTYANSEKHFINATETKVGTTVSWNNNTTSQRDFEPTTNKVESKAYVAKGANKITIETDSVTGEWAAELLPLKYTVESVQIIKNKDITFSNLPTLDATNTQRVSTDSIDGQEFKYVASAKIKYKSKSIIELTENEDGSFGEKSVKVKGLDGNEVSVPFYTIENNTVNYTFGHPVYQEMGMYNYLLHAYERYVNYDVTPAVEDIVPLANKLVKIENQYATGVSISLEDGTVVEGNEKEFELDSLGYLSYTFTAGLPNIQEPYTRGISIAFENSGTMIPWEGNNTFKAIVLGAISTGNNFTTQAPDQVLMILRDPPGTGSSITYSKGITHTDEGTLSVSAKIGGKLEYFTNGAIQIKTANGVGVAVITESTVSGQTGGSFETTATVGTNNSWAHTTVLNEDISTSTEPDFVGAPGDLFIGVSKNTIFGACHIVKVKKNEQTGQYELVMEDGYSTGEEFGTTFTHSQNYIENRLIPDFENLRNSLLVTVPDMTKVAHPAKGEKAIYVTTYSPDDEKYGTNNYDKIVWGAEAKEMSSGADPDGVFRGPSYWMILPEDWKTSGEIYQDMVQFYNEQMKGWRKQLAKNEEAKVLAIQNRDEYLIDNYTIDAGGSFTRTTEVTDVDAHSFENTEEVQAIVSDAAKMDQDGNGFEMKIEMSSNYSASTTYVNTDEKTTGFSFTIAESGDDDYLSVDVYNAPDNFGPIFYTRGGATSCPYEDEVVTKYYEPGFVISEKTVQIEKPEIEAATQLLTGIPAGGKGTFQVYIRNNSDTSEDGWFDIGVVQTSNPDGLKISMDGVAINTGRTILVPAGETMVKTFTVEQTNPDVLNYEDIKLRISSQCQPDNTGVFPEIADTTTISVYFQPTCSDVQLASTHTLVNTDTETPVTLSISGYNYSMQSLKGIRLQYKGANEANFKTIQEYSKDEASVAADKNLILLPALEGTSKLNYVIDLRQTDFSDQTYVFRAITVCDQGGIEVNNESEEVTIIRDMTRPQLIAQPTPASGILGAGDDLTITFNEDIQGGILSKPNNFDVFGVLNESYVAHDVALSMTGSIPAKTEATMDLSGKSFSTSMWLNYSSDGRLLQHGTKDQNFTVSIEEGKLAVSTGGTKVVSKEALPADKWLYLNVAYNAETSTVSAGYAQDASTVSLLANADMPAYEGNGPVSVGGENFNGKMQELAIWNNARSMAEAQADMYTTKSQFTSGLMGYWQLNEGHGDVATDKARSRNLTLPTQNAWWIYGDNYALTLDGTKAAAASIGALNTTASEDYLVEAWFKADKQQNGVASILSTQVMDLRLNAQGKMELALGGSTMVNRQSSMVNGQNATEVLNQDLRDGQWHHVAVNVLKSTNGSGIVYVDGQQRKQFSASAMPALYGEKLMLGSHRTSVDGQSLYTYDQMLKGAIDEVRIWKARRTADVIKDNMYNRVKADETGLVAYYPMESTALDTYNQVVTAASLTNSAASSLPAEELAFFTEAAATATGTTSKDNTAALKQAKEMENVQFSFVASERQIKVNLEEQPYKMEGCNIYITAKNVKDINGNPAQPITWGVYVQQNNLRWLDNDLAITKTGAESIQFTASIENRGSQSESWSLSGMPTWLSANTEAGTLSPLSTAKLTFTVADALPIGTYETTVYMTGSQNIAAPLNITVTSEGSAPLWTAIPGESTMTIVGVLNIDGVQSSDTKDMVAAFRGQECVGVASPKYFSRYDSYIVTMSIYGKEEAQLSYKAYDASTGTIYPSVQVSNHAAYTFGVDKAIGSFTNAVTFTPLNEIEQDLSMDSKGWKWFSLHATPKETDASLLFKDAKDAIAAITDGTTSVVNWLNEMALDNPAMMYKLNATEPYVETIVGEPTDPTAIDITLKKGWTWIGYPAQGTNSISAAFASANPQEGDIVKNQSTFSIYTDGDWVGTLTAMVPGEGYLYGSEASSEKTFRYPKPAVSGRKNAPQWSMVNDQSSMVNGHHFKDNMTMIAVVMQDDEIVEDAQVSVYANRELRAFSAEAVANNRHFLTIGGQDGDHDILTFVVTTAEGDFMVANNETFVANAMRGTTTQPVVLQLREATGIDSAVSGMSIKSIQLFDSTGRLVRSIDHPTRLLTKADLKALPAGVYYQQVTYDNGRAQVQKLMR